MRIPEDRAAQEAPMNSRSKRLCIVTPHHARAVVGGSEYQIELLLEALIQQQQFEIYYLARSVDVSFRPTGYDIVRIGNRNRTPRFGYATDALPLYRALRALRPAVVYERVACGYSGICAWYARHNNARMIWHVAHDTDVMLEHLDAGRNPLRRFLETACIEYAIRRSNHIVTQTEHQALLLEQNYGRSADGVIRNFQPDPVEAIDKSGPTTVLWVANFKRWKQPELFVELANRLRDLRAVRFVMAGAAAAGSGNISWNASIMQQIDAAPNIEYLGPLGQSDINRLFARAHIFVNTSTSEGFPNTFIQAWMREVPVVSLNVNPDNVLEREGVGILARSVAGLADAVRGLVIDSARRAQCGARARRYAMRQHSLANVAILTQLIDTGRMHTAEHGSLAAFDSY
jgi:glycosyltransferase involved in cell wall biosynthesis